MQKKLPISRLLNVTLALLAVTMFLSCTDSKQRVEIEKKYQDSIASLRIELQHAQQQIELLKYPANQRYSHILSLFETKEYEKVRAEIAELKRVFPQAKENDDCKEILNKVKSAEAAKKAEEERVKALGFKAINEHSTIKIGYNTVTLSHINVSNQFTFDAYDDRWFYRDADRGSKYVTMQMSVTSSDHNPNLPQFAIYVISGDKMKFIGTFDTKFARWRDYGAYLGNYHDSSNDFSKVSTVKFKLGMQVSNEQLAKPYAIVLMKKNVLSYHYERFDNPPISYIGTADYPASLSLKDFSSNYVLIKRYNL